MRTRFLLCASMVAIGMLTAPAAVAAPRTSAPVDSSAPDGVDVVDLGLPGHATAVNHRGSIVGNTLDEHGESQAFAWVQGRTSTVAPAPSWATDINSGGDIVGYRTLTLDEGYGPDRAYLWRKGEFVDLPHEFSAFPTRAFAINDQGLVVGGAYSTASSAAVLWDGGMPSYLWSYARFSAATGVNNSGIIVGDDLHSQVCSSYRWELGTAYLLGRWWSAAPPEEAGSGFGCYVRGINDRGDILNRTQLWQDGTITELATLVGQPVEATAISNSNIVGTTVVGGVTHGFLWDGDVLHDLGPGTPADVNNRGQVVGSIDGRAVMWTVRTTDRSHPRAGRPIR